MSDSVSESGNGLSDLRGARRRRRIAPDGLKIDRLPPHEQEAEQGVLGCILLSPSPMDCLSQVTSICNPNKEVFYDLRHQTIYETMVEMFNRNDPIDVITLQAKLKDRKMLDQIGGVLYLNALQDMVPSAANVTYYANLVMEKFLLRKIIHTCSDAVGKVYEYEGEPLALLDEVERDIMQIRERPKEQRSNIKQLVNRSIGVIEEKFQRQGAISGISTGFRDLDRYTDGLCAGELIVPAAFPSVGKTSLLMNMVEHVVLDQKLSAAVFSLEMTAEQLVTRFLCSRARVNLRKIGNGLMAESDFPKLTSAAGKVAAAKLFIIDDLTTVAQIRAEARRLKQAEGISMIGVDYIQRVHAETGKSSNREQEIASISSGLKSIATELKVPVVAPSQLNEEGKLRESRAIGQDADQVWMMERDEENMTEEAEPVKLWIRKNRNGPRDVCVNLTFMKCFTRFESASKVSDEDVPRD